MSIRTTFLLVVALLLVAGYRLMAETPTDTEAGDDAPWFYTASEDDIRRISVEQGEFKSSFLYKEDRTWYFDEPFGPPVDLARWGGVTLLLGGPKTKRVVAEQVADPTEFGLDTPFAVINASLTGDRTLEITLGDTTPNGSFHYATRDGDPRLYLIDSLWGVVLSRLAVEPPLPPWFYRVSPERTRFLSVTQGEATVELTRDFSGEWRFAQTDPPPLDLERWRNVLPLLGGPPTIRILQDKLEDFGRYGLLEPRVLIVVETDPPQGIEAERRRLEMEIGAELEDGSGSYAKVVGQPFLFFVDSPWLETIVGLVLEPPIAPVSG